MVDVTVIILTKNEELHLGRCLERLRALGPRRVVVVDSESTDATADLARREGAEVIIHPWPGNQAAQFNWALDNLPILTEWVLRLDADEYLSPELTEEIRAKLPEMPADVSALVLPLGRYFLNRRLRHGIVNGIAMVRMFRRGCCRYEQRLMDEHLQILSGRALTLTHPFYDHSLLPLSAFIAKHNGYADREAALLLAENTGLRAQMPTRPGRWPTLSRPSDGRSRATGACRCSGGRQPISYTATLSDWVSSTGRRGFSGTSCRDGGIARWWMPR